MFQNEVTNLYFDLRHRKKKKEQQQNTLINVRTEKAQAHWSFTTKLVLLKKLWRKMQEMLMVIQVIQGSSSLEHPDLSFDSLPMQPSNHKSRQEFPAQEWHLACDCARRDQELGFWSLDHFQVEGYVASSPGSVHWPHSYSSSPVQERLWDRWKCSMD